LIFFILFKNNFRKIEKEKKLVQNFETKNPYILKSKLLGTTKRKQKQSSIGSKEPKSGEEGFFLASFKTDNHVFNNQTFFYLNC
jgi:hypothetical protein